MRILILDSAYKAFLNAFYRDNPEAARWPYDRQWAAIMSEFFGVADAYSHSLRKAGHEAHEILWNAGALQQAWANEHGLVMRKPRRVPGRKGLLPWLVPSPYDDAAHQILEAQIKDWKPDVLYVQEMNYIRRPFLRRVRPYAKFICGQIACPIVPGADFREYDLILSSFPHYVDRFRRQKLRSEYLPLGFDPRVREHLQEDEPRRDVVFVGGVSRSFHPERVEFLERLQRLHPFDFWGSGDSTLEKDSPLRRAHQGHAWGLRMYSILHRARISLNYHIREADRFANNARLFEATGVGTLLFTDRKENLGDFFVPDREVVVFDSPDDCAEKIRYYLDHEAEREAVAKAGQARTLAEHTWQRRMETLTAILGKTM